MDEQANYRQAMDACPNTITRWGQIAMARNPSAPEHTKSLHELAALYDRPLRLLFETICRRYAIAASAEDWKQDFVVSHLLTGRVYKTIRRDGRFRAFLAVAVRNYIANRRAAAAADKRRAADGARPFSQIERPADDSPGEQLGYSQTDEDMHGLLTRARAWDIFNDALLALEQWCMARQDASGAMRITQEIRDGTLKLRGPSVPEDPAWRKVVHRFKELLRRGVREEVQAVAAQTGEDEQFIAGREISVFLDALNRE